MHIGVGRELRDIQNYPNDIFWGCMVPAGKASLPSGAVAGGYDIGEGADGFGYEPDDSTLLWMPSTSRN